MKNTKNYLLISAWVIVTMLLAYFIYSIISTNSLIDQIESQIVQPQNTKKSDLSEQKYTFQEKLEIFDRDQICKSRAEYRRDRIDQEWKSRFLTIFYSPILNSCVIASVSVSPYASWYCVYETDDPGCDEKTNTLDVRYVLSEEGIWQLRNIGVRFAKDVQSWWVVVYYEEDDESSKMQKSDSLVVTYYNPVGWNDVFVGSVFDVTLSSLINYRQEEDYYKNKKNNLKYKPWIIALLNDMFVNEITFLRGWEYERKPTSQFFTGDGNIYWYIYE